MGRYKIDKTKVVSIFFTVSSVQESIMKISEATTQRCSFSVFLDSRQILEKNPRRSPFFSQISSRSI